MPGRMKPHLICRTFVPLLFLSHLFGQPAAAADYKPVTCKAAAPYAGAPRHAAISFDAPPPHGHAIDPAALDTAASAALTKTGTPTASLAVAQGDAAPWLREHGIAPDRPLHFWASAGKTFIAVAILQLVDEGKLSLDDRASRWFTGLPNGDAITIRHLLEHRSGLFSTNEDPKVRESRRAYSIDEMIRIAARHGAMFCPGANWRYSNTGYALLGEIVARVDGRPWPEAVTARMITPLGLKHMRVLDPGEAAADTALLQSSHEAPINPSWAGAAGAIVGRADDMVRFWQALLAGQLLKPATLRLMFADLYPMFDKGTYYGLGVMLFEVPRDDGTSAIWIGHSGGTPGANAVVAHEPATGRFAATAITGDGQAPPFVNLLFTRLREGD